MRFYGSVAIAFVIAFAGVSWASRGFPVGQDVATLLLGKPSAPREQRSTNQRDTAHKLDPCDPAARVQLQKPAKSQATANGAPLSRSEAERRDPATEALRTTEIMSSDIPRMLAQIQACVPDAPFP